MNVRKTKLVWLVSAAIFIVLVAIAITTITNRPSVPDFKSYAAGPERKAQFFDYFLPLVQLENTEVRMLRAQLLELKTQDTLSNSQKKKLQKVAKEYRMESFSIDNKQDWEILLKRVDIVPPSLALAQAANESAWGTSRFALMGYNYFGQWCFEKGCGIVPSNRDVGKNHEVADFDTPQESVEKYIHNLNQHPAYATLRGIRAKLRDQRQAITGLALAAGLDKYSERGEEYIKEIRSMIRYNDLSRFDTLDTP